MKNYPIFLSLTGKKVVIAGGGEAAAQKARLARSAGATLTFIAPTFEPSLQDEFSGLAQFHDRAVEANDFEGAALAYVAVADPTEQKKLTEMARAAGVLVNVVDAPALCDFTTPSIVDRDDVVVAISTNGKAPVLGQSIRAQIEQMLSPRLGGLVDFAAQFRPAVKARFGARTRQFWKDFFAGTAAQKFLSGDEVTAHTDMIRLVNSDNERAPEPEQGFVHIVGAGPGDPELLTLKAHRLLQEADVIFYDRLVSEEILSLARRDAKRVFVGKQKSNHAVPQEEIHTLMIEEAKRGQMVVRLKGGDPFIFGRGGEELEALQAANIDAAITPGITAASGCAAATGIALTHRDHAQMLTFVTGHARGDEDPDIDWGALSQSNMTAVVYMGVSKAAAIASRLIKEGRAASTPVAVVENGTRADQIVATGTLRDLPLIIEQAGIKGPAMLIIGDVATMVQKNSPPMAAQYMPIRQEVAR